MLQLLYIGIAGGLGAMSRYGLTHAIDKIYPSNISLGTLSINIAGSFLITLLFVLAEGRLISASYMPALTVGFLGSFTTFSTYSLHAIMLFRAGQIKSGLWHILLNNGLSLLFALFGMLLAYYILKCINNSAVIGG